MHFFFNFRSPTHFYPDSEGGEFETITAAREESRLAARELLGLDRGEPALNYAGGAFEITTRDGIVVAVVPFEELALGDR